MKEKTLTIKEKLRNIKNEITEIKKLQEKRDFLWSALLPKGITLKEDKIQVSGSLDALGDKMVEINEIESIIEERVQKLIRAHIEMEKLINKLDDSRYRLVLELYYMDTSRTTWEDVAKTMEYSISEIYKLHGKALKKLNEVYSQL